MDEKQMEAILEAVLFTMGKSVSVSALSQMLECTEAAVWKVLRTMQRTYREEKRGIQLMELEDRVQLCTAKEYYPWLIRLVSQPKKPVLTEAVLETLSIIAYKQPIIRSEIEKIRGVSSTHAVNRLLEYGLIEEKGRLEAPGRPVLFGTTEEFLRTFGVSSIMDLPVADDSLMEELRASVSAEEADEAAEGPEAAEETVEVEV